MSRLNTMIAGRYLIKELIGQGGMADVYLCEDTILHRVVAIKLLRSSLTGDPVYITRFHREASAAAALSHKNIVEIYDVGEENDDYYIVMEYVPGQTLKELIHKRGALHYAEAVDIMKQVTSATAKAHSMGIIHRDLKPQNILVTDSGVVKIADFGIASIQSLSQVTKTDTIMGSLHYLAPELARGEKATVQSDVYALGIVFYELLRGEVPFNGESPVNIALKHMREEIPSVKEFNPSIPQSVENVIIKATAKNLKDRYSYAKEMYDDLSTCLYKHNEPKLVFTYEGEEEPTIIADNDKFFTSENKIKPKDVEKEAFQKDKTKNIKNNKKSKKKYIFIIIAILIIAIIGAVFFFTQDDGITMPNVIGLTQEEAIQKLTEQKLNVDKSKTQEELSKELDAGLVISTNPISNSTVHPGDEVILTISSGKYIVIDNYVGLRYDDVQLLLTDSGFEVTKKEVSSDEDVGIITKQSIEPTEEYDPNDSKKIVLTVSKGKEITVPNVYGQTISAAKQLLESSDYGFKVKLKVLTPPTDANEIATMQLNVVYKQSIKAFTKMTNPQGKTITLYYYDTKPEVKKEEVKTDDIPIDNTTETTTETENEDNQTQETQTNETE